MRVEKVQYLICIPRLGPKKQRTKEKRRLGRVLNNTKREVPIDQTWNAYISTLLHEVCEINRENQRSQFRKTKTNIMLWVSLKHVGMIFMIGTQPWKCAIYSEGTDPRERVEGYRNSAEHVESIQELQQEREKITPLLEFCVDHQGKEKK